MIARVCRSTLSHVRAVVHASRVPLSVGLVVPGSIVAYHSSCVAVHCKNRGTRSADSLYRKPYKRQHSNDKKWDDHLNWSKLWEFISPDLILLLGATAVSCRTIKNIRLLLQHAKTVLSLWFNFAECRSFSITEHFNSP